MLQLARASDGNHAFAREPTDLVQIFNKEFDDVLGSLTQNNRGQEVYGGSELTVARGDFDALLALDAAPEIRLAVEQAQRYNAAAIACFPGFFASRNNYDIILGRDAAGRALGCAGAILAARRRHRRRTRRAEVFRVTDRARVRASGFEIFGESPPPPPHATVYFRGIDPRAGRLTKYTVVNPMPTRDNPIDIPVDGQHIAGTLVGPDTMVPGCCWCTAGTAARPVRRPGARDRGARLHLPDLRPARPCAPSGPARDRHPRRQPAGRARRL